MIARRALLGALAASAGSLLAPCALQAAPLAKVKEQGRLRIAVYQDNRPWSWADGAGLHGIDVDLGKALAAQLGVAAEVVDFMPGDDLAADLRNTVWRGGLLGFQPCDVMLHVPFDHELQLANDQVAILAPYCREGFAMLCGSDVDCEAPPPHFRGLRLAAETASASDAYLLGAFGGVLRGDVHHFRNGYDAAAAVGSGQADMAMATAAQVEAASHDATASLHRRRGPLPAMSSPGWDVAMAVKENSRTLGDALENIIGKMVANGQMAALFAAHGVSWKAALAG